MNIFEQIVKHREHFIDTKGYRPVAVYLGSDEALAFDKWARDNLPCGLDVSDNQRNRIIDMNIYVVDAVNRLDMV